MTPTKNKQFSIIKSSPDGRIETHKYDDDETAWVAFMDMLNECMGKGDWAWLLNPDGSVVMYACCKAYMAKGENNGN